MSNLDFSQNSQKIANLRAISPFERYSVNFLTKKVSQPHRNLVIFSKKRYQKTMISDSKTWKILKVQKWHQKASRSPWSRVMSKFWIWEFGNLRAISPSERCSLNFSTKKASQPLRKLAIFSKKWYQKTMISDTKTWKILKVQKWRQKASRSL